MSVLIKEFEHDLALRRRSIRTIQGYRCCVVTFLNHYPNPTRVKNEELEEYLAILLARGLQPETVKSTFSALSSYYEFLLYKKVISQNPIPNFRRRFIDTDISSSRRQIIKISDMRTLIGSFTHIRERAMFTILAKTGIRRGELLALKVSDLDLKQNILTIKRQKRAKNLIRFIDPELHQTIREYLIWRDSRVKDGKCKTLNLFLSNQGAQYPVNNINGVLQCHAEAVGLHDPDPYAPLERKMSCHCFRGFLTTHLRRQGMREEYIMVLLGHSLDNNTWSGHYLKIDMEDVRAEYLRCVPQLL